MSFWDKVKDFVGIEDDYYEEDEYYEDYEDYDDYNEDEKSEENTNEAYFNEVKEEEKPKRSYESSYTPAASSQTSKKANPVKRSYGSKNDMQVSIREPLTFDDSKSVLDDIIEGKTVVLNLEMLEVDKKTQIFYFVSGGLYSLNGSISNVTKDIYVLVPEGVEISDKLAKTVTDKSLYQI